MPLWSLTPVHRPHAYGAKLMSAMLPADLFPNERQVFVTNGPDAPSARDLPPGVTIVPATTPDVSVAAWWRQGMEHIYAADPDATIAFVDADALPGRGTVRRLHDALWTHNLAMAGVDRTGILPHGVWVTKDRMPYRDLRWRPGWYCWLLAPGTGVWPDPQFGHWYLDDDMEWQARNTRRGHTGVGLVADTPCYHPKGARWEGETDEVRDAARAKFYTKWGSLPW